MLLKYRDFIMWWICNGMIRRNARLLEWVDKVQCPPTPWQTVLHYHTSQLRPSSLSDSAHKFFVGTNR